MAKGTNQPRLHPNGFIQYDLPAAGRLHIWHPDLPMAQIIHTPIHDHTFDFTSRIVCGKLTHVVFNFYEKMMGEYHLHRAVVTEGEDTLLKPLAILGDMVEAETYTFHYGQQYSFSAGRFHLSKGDGLTATIMTKTATKRLPFARIAVPLDVDPDNNFRRHQYDAMLLMKYVEMVTSRC